MRVAVTGASGFLGRNLLFRLRELGYHDVVQIRHSADARSIEAAVTGVDFVFHLAGVNRPQNASEFATGNHAFTRDLCSALAAQRCPARVAYASSTQAALENPYGHSKRSAEDELLAYSRATGAAVHIFRLPNVFGKWSRPNYNSAVATFCHNVARGKSISVNDPSAPLRLIYVDDVVRAFCALLESGNSASGYRDVGPAYETSVGEVARQIQAFHASRSTLLTERVGTGLARALYATYVSFLPPPAFDYRVASHSDPRGVFVEMIKTHDSGQIGYFTALPGITRGEHYHHTKTEKFLVVKGTASFGYRNILTNEAHEIIVRGGEGRIVETIPGWTHNVRNIGEDELVVLVWANEIFDQTRPDTIAEKVDLP